MGEAVAIIILGLCLLSGGTLISRSVTRTQVPRMWKEWRGLSAQSRYDIPDDEARVAPILMGVIIAMFGLALLIVGAAMLVGVIVRKL